MSALIGAFFLFISPSRPFIITLPTFVSGVYQLIYLFNVYLSLSPNLYSCFFDISFFLFSFPPSIRLSLTLTFLFDATVSSYFYFLFCPCLSVFNVITLLLFFWSLLLFYFWLQYIFDVLYCLIWILPSNTSPSFSPSAVLFIPTCFYFSSLCLHVYLLFPFPLRHSSVG